MKSKFVVQGKMKARRQLGASLMDAMLWIAIAAVVVGGSLSLLGSSNSGNSSLELTKDIIAIRQATKKLFLQSGGYSTGSLNSSLITANQIPSTLSTSSPTINTSLGGTLTVTGNTSNFKIELTNVPSDVCTSLLTSMSNGWKSVQVGSSSAITTFPVLPTTATTSANCGGSGPFTVTWTTLN